MTRAHIVCQLPMTGPLGDHFINQMPAVSISPISWCGGTIPSGARIAAFRLGPIFQSGPAAGLATPHMDVERATEMREASIDIFAPAMNEQGWAVVALYAETLAGPDRHFPRSILHPPWRLLFRPTPSGSRYAAIAAGCSSIAPATATSAGASPSCAATAHGREDITAARPVGTSDRPR